MRGAGGLRMRTAAGVWWAGAEGGGAPPLGPRGEGRRPWDPRGPSLHFRPLAAQPPLAAVGRLESESSQYHA